MKKRKLYILLAVEAFLLLLCIVNLFGKRVSLEMDAAFFEGSGIYDETRGGWYIDETFGANEAFLVSDPLHIPAGVYKVALTYETDTDMCNLCTVFDAAASLGGVISNGTNLYAGLGSTDYEVWLTDGNGSLQIQVSFGGVGYLLVKGVRIYDSGAMQRMILLTALLLFICLDLGLWYRLRTDGKGMTAENKLVAAGLLLTVAASSYPLMTNYVMSGGDLVFHLLRIEGVKDALLSGQFPVRIAPEWQCGHGYAASIFYGDTLLFIPAILRLTGFSIQTSYKIFLFLLNIGTCLISYYAFAKVFRNKYLGSLCSLLYTMSIYRFFKMYYSAALGEVISMMFIPLLVAGLYRIFTEDVEEPKYRRNWVLPAIGFCGMVQSHILSTYIVACFTILLCILMWRKVFCKETFVVLAKTVVVTALVSAWFLVPFLDNMSSGAYVVNHISGRLIQCRGLQVAQLFKLFFNVGRNWDFYNNGLVSAEPLGLGCVLAVGLGLFGLLVWSRKTDNLERGMLKAGKIAAFMGICAMAMSTYLFPWDRIQRLGALTEMMTGPLEFPSRFLSVATIAAVFVTGVAGTCIWKMEKPALKAWFMAGISGLALLGGTYVLNEMCDSLPPIHLYNVGGMGTGYISSGEYLPVGTDTSRLTYRAPSTGEGVEIHGYEKKYLTVSTGCTNHSQVEGYIDMPILYYEGYRAWSGAGKRLEVCAGENNAVRVLVPGGYEGTISVRFVSPWYWRMAEVISVVVLVGLLGQAIMLKRKGMK